MLRKRLLVLFIAPAVFVPFLLWAAVLKIDPSKGCPGTEVQITGAGWLEPEPVCHYRFLFDHPNPGQFKEDIAGRQPDGLFGPPDSSFTVPADTKPGPHKVRVQLFLDTGEFLQQEQQPFTVLGVKFEGPTKCSLLDSGFDDTNAAPNAPWVSVAVGQTTKVAKAKITPAGDAKEIKFKSSDTGLATVSPSQATTSPQVLDIKGVAEGETTIEAFTGTDAMCKSVSVAAYNKHTVKISVHLIQMKKASGELCVDKPINVSKKSLQDNINKIWDQAAVQFTILKVDKFLGTKAIQSDDDNDCIADENEPPPGPTDPVNFGPELQKIHNAAKDANAEVNVYFVAKYQIPIAAYHTGPKAIFVGNLSGESVEEVVAHELGHHLTLGHRAGTDALMQPQAPATLCLLNKVEWDKANPL